MSEKFRLDHNFGFRNTFYSKCINIIIDNIGPSIILRSIYFDRKWENDSDIHYIDNQLFIYLKFS